MKFLATALSAVCVVLLALAAHAVEAFPTKHDAVTRAKILPRGTFRVKLELNAQGIVALLIQDKDWKKVSSDGYKAALVIVRASRRQGPYVLTPAGDNRLEGKTSDWLGPGGIRLLTLWTPDGDIAEFSYRSPDPATPQPQTDGVRL